MSSASNERKNARRRARKAVAQADVGQEIELVYGKPIEQWDDEEIYRGRARNEDGRFTQGRRPTWLTPALQAERQRRLRQLMTDELGTFAGDGLRTLHSVMMDDSRDETGKPNVPASVRVDVGKYLVDQFMGKATATVDVHAGSQLTELMGAILINPDGEPSHRVIDGEVVDQDPSAEDDLPDYKQIQSHDKN
jgi:hypothetical protein